jgi:hypothetical protein
VYGSPGQVKIDEDRKEDWPLQVTRSDKEEEEGPQPSTSKSTSTSASKRQAALRAAPAPGLHTSDNSQGAKKKGDEEAAKNQEEEMANKKKEEKGAPKKQEEDEKSANETFASSPSPEEDGGRTSRERLFPPPPSWGDAVPFTLTLDVDFGKIGDHEDFKQGILADVAAAAKVDVIYFKIQMLCAGSVIVHLLIAPEVGEPRKVLQDLQKQANSPGSCLMAGKLTSKTKNLKEGFDDMALFQELEKAKVWSACAYLRTRPSHVHLLPERIALHVQARSTALVRN